MNEKSYPHIKWSMTSAVVQSASTDFISSMETVIPLSASLGTWESIQKVIFFYNLYQGLVSFVL